MIRKLYSEKTKKYYNEDEIDKLEAEEKAYDDKIRAEEAKKTQRETDAKEIEELIKKAEGQRKGYNETVSLINEKKNAFLKKYGSFHITVKDTNGNQEENVDIFDLLFDGPFKFFKF